MTIENIKNKKLTSWMNEMIELVKPEKVVLIDGSEEQAEQLRAEACASGEMFKLNQEKLPGCYLHHTALNDVARVENRTFICSRRKEDAGATNNWMDPQECYAKLTELYRGSYAGKTMYVIPYSMGVVGSNFAKYGIELTDSIYVVLNMLIMTRVGLNVLEGIGEDGDFIKGLHARANMDENNRYIVHFPEDNTIWSINSGYGGNVLLGKKCFALRIASYLGRNEGWMAEHMLILGVEGPDGETKYVAAAFPSACGKTNLRNTTAIRATRSGLSVMISLGSDPVRTADFGLSTPKTASSALLPAQMKSPIPTLLPAPVRTPSSPMLLLTQTTTQFGGKVSQRLRPLTASTGRAKSMIPLPAKRLLTRTPASPLLQDSAPAFPRNLTA